LSKFIPCLTYSSLHSCVGITVYTELSNLRLFDVAFINKSSAVAEMGDRLATIDMGRKRGCAHLGIGGGGAGYPSNNADKTELLFASSCHSCAMLSGGYPILHLGADTAVACSHVRLRGVDISSDLCLDHHVSRMCACAGCYYRLRQLRRIRRLLDSDSLATLIYAVVNSRINYCNTFLVGAPRTVTDKLQRVLNVAVRIVTGTRKFDCGLCQILHDELHWLDVPDQVFFKLAVIVHRCLNGRRPQYLSDYCVPAAGADTR